MKSLPLALCALALAALGGCATDTGTLSARFNPSLYSVHQPVVQRTDYVIDLASGGGLMAGEDLRLHAWFDTLRIGYGDRVSTDAGDEASRAAVAAVAAAYGLLLEDGAPVTAGAGAPGTLRVVVSRTTASVPGCPDWSHAGQPGAPISTHSNYGCAVNSNLAAMIADPNDLVRGRTGDTVGDAAAVAKAVKSYRDRPQTGAAGQLAETGGKE